MLRATRELATGQGRILRKGVDVTGFSQGASAALGLARELERDRGWLHARMPWLRSAVRTPSATSSSPRCSTAG